MKKFLLLICLLGLIFIIPGPALAEKKEKEAEKGIIKLEEIVVTATKTEKRLKMLPAVSLLFPRKRLSAVTSKQ